MGETPEKRTLFFDFSSDPENTYPSSSTELERRLFNTLRNGMLIQKMMVLKIYGNEHKQIVYTRGFSQVDIKSVEDALTPKEWSEKEDGFTPWPKTTIENAYLLSVHVDSQRYCIIAVLPKPISVQQQQFVLSMIDLITYTADSGDKMHVSLMSQFNELVLNNIVSGIIVIDKDARIRFVNRAAEMMLGYRCDSLGGQPCSVLFREIDRDQNWLQFTLTTGSPSLRKKNIMVRDDGIALPVAGTTSLLKNSDGTIFGVLAIFREYEEVELEIQRKTDLNKVSTLAKLSASIAHEIRNPLAGISATAQVLATKLMDDERKLRFVNVILEEIDRINRIIKELLNFASPTKASFLQSNVNKILEQALDLLHKKIQKQRVEVVREYDRELPEILCDENQLKQAVVNIMLNAISAMPDGGIITVASQQIHLHDEPWIKIIIQDTGPGIPPEVLEELFTPFTTTKTQGLGLGLTITKNIIRMHRGKIEAVNLDDCGTRFTILLPVRKTQIDFDDQTYLPLE